MQEHVQALTYLSDRDLRDIGLLPRERVQRGEFQWRY